MLRCDAMWCDEVERAREGWRRECMCVDIVIDRRRNMYVVKEGG